MGRRKNITNQAWPAWRDTVKVGDVLQSPAGDYRVVRGITRWPPRARGRAKHGKGLIFFQFAIRRCSWTRRCTTTKSGADMNGWIHTGHSVALDSPLDRQIARELEYENRHKQRLGCCDVVYAL